MKKFLNEFKTFISRGNVMDMAIGVVIATRSARSVQVLSRISLCRSSAV